MADQKAGRTRTVRRRRRPRAPAPRHWPATLAPLLRRTPSPNRQGAAPPGPLRQRASAGAGYTLGNTRALYSGPRGPAREQGFSAPARRGPVQGHSLFTAEPESGRRGCSGGYDERPYPERWGRNPGSHRVPFGRCGGQGMTLGTGETGGLAGPVAAR